MLMNLRIMAVVQLSTFCYLRPDLVVLVSFHDGEVDTDKHLEYINKWIRIISYTHRYLA